MSFLDVALWLIGLSTFGSLLRVILGPTIWDRMLGVGLVATKITLGTVLIGLRFSAGYVFDLALLFAALGFLATVLLARFVEQRGEL